MKIIAYIVGVVLALVVAAAVILPSVIDLNDYKDVIAARVKAATGRDLVIGGNIDVAILPAPTIAVSDLRLANIAGGTAPEMVRLAAVEARIALLPLLRGEVQVESIRFVEPVIELERLADGRVNWDFGGGIERKAGAGAAVRLDNVVIDSGSVFYRNAASGIEERIAGLSIVGGADSLAGPFRAKGRMVARGVPLSFKLAVGALDRSATPVSVELGLPTVEGSASFSGSFRPNAGDAKLIGKLSLAGPSLSRAIAALDPMNTDEPSTWLFDRAFSATAALTASTTAAKLEDLTFELDGVLGSGAVDAEFAGAPQIDVALTLSRVDLDALLPAEGARRRDDASSNQGAAAAPFALPAGIGANLDLKVNALVYNQAVVRQIALAMTLENGVVALQQASALLPGGSDIAVFGALDSANGKPRFRGQVEVSVDNLRAVLDWLAIPVPAVPADRLRKLSYSSKLEFTPGLAKISAMDLRVDLTRISGGVNVGLGGRPAFNAIVNVDRLNLDAYLPVSDEGQAPQTPDAGDANPLAVLDAVNGELKLRVGRLVYQALPIEGLSLDAGLRRGILEVRSLEFDNAWGAQGVISGTIDATGPAFDLRYGIKTEELGRLLRLAGIASVVPKPGIGRFTAHGSVSGDFSEIKLEAAVATADVEATLAGTVSNLGLEPTADLAVDVQGRDVARVARQFGIALPLAPQPTDSPFTLKGKIGGNATRADVRLGLSMLGVDARISGTVNGPDGAPGYDLAVKASHPDLAALAGSFAAGDSSGARELGGVSLGVSLSARVAGDATEARLSAIDAAFGPNRLGGEATVRWDDPRPSLDAAFTAGDIVADMFLAPAVGGETTAGSGAPGQTGAERWSREPIDLSGLSALDARVQLEAKSLALGAFKFDNAQLRLALIDGVLDIEELSGQLFGAPAEVLGQLADADVPTAEIEILLDGADIRRLLGNVAGVDAVSGRATLAGGFRTAGRSAFDMISALAGEVTVDLRDGVIRGVDLARLNRRLGSLGSELDFLNLVEAALGGGETRIEALDGSFMVSQGVARTTDLRAVLDGGEVRAEGTIDLPRWLIDLDSEFRLTGHPNAPSIGVGLKGPIDNPTREIGDEELRIYVAEKLLGGVLDQVVPSIGADTGTDTGAGAAIGDVLKALVPTLGGATGAGAATGEIVTKVEPQPGDDTGAVEAAVEIVPKVAPEPEPSEDADETAGEVLTKVEPEPEPEPEPSEDAGAALGELVEKVEKTTPQAEPVGGADTGSAIGSLLDTLTGGSATRTAPDSAPDEAADAQPEPEPAPVLPFNSLLKGILQGSGN